MKKLEELLKLAEKPELSQKKKLQVRENLLFYVKNREQSRMMMSFSGIINAIRSAVAEIKVDAGKKASMKEHLMTMIESHSQKRFFWSNFASFHRNFAGALLAVFLFFGVFNFMTLSPTVVNASTLTVLSVVEGGVLVERDGEFIDVYEDLVLESGDSITTSSDSLAVIQYFDDSVTRLDSNTQIVITSLDRPRDNSLNSYVEISLLDGMLWSRVINLVDENSAFVVNAAEVSTKTQRGAFNIEVGSDEVEVGVFNYSVEIESEQNIDKVISGEKLTVQNSSKFSKKEKLDVNTQDDWIKGNLFSDGVYLASVEDDLLVSKMESIGVKGGDKIEFDNSLKESTALFLTFDDVKKQTLKLDLAERNFIAAQIKLGTESLTVEEKLEVEEVFETFTLTFSDFYSLIDEVETRDSEYADDLKFYAESKLSAQEKGVATLAPNDPAYAAKIVLDDLAISGADNDEDLLKVKQGQAGEKLYLVENAVNEGDFELADQIIEDYKKDINDVAVIIESLSDDSPDDNEEAVSKFVSDLNEDLYFLNAIDQVAEATEGDLADETDVYAVLEVLEFVDKDKVFVKEIETEFIEEAGGETEEEDELEEEIVTPVIEGDFGVPIVGDKPLDPLFR
jgi:hypothetical protein